MSAPQLPCGACGTMNAIATSWCRQCGAKLVFDPEAVQAAVMMSDREQGDRRWLLRGLAWLPLGVFVLIMGVIVRVSAPALPPAEPPALAWGSIVPEAVPVRSAVPSPVAAAEPATARPGSLLDWRMGHGPQILGDLGLDLGVLDIHAATVAAAQQRDGGWGSPAATAFAVLALQAHPIPSVQTAADRGRGWLLARREEWRRWPSMARSMTVTALAEAGLAGKAEVDALDILLVDGQAGPWQTLFLLQQPVRSVPGEWAGLDRDLVLLPLAARRHGRPGAGEPPRERIVLQALDRPRGDERLAAALAAWTSGDEPRALAAWLRDAARLAGPAPDLPPTPWTDRAAALLVGTVPARLPAGWTAAPGP